MPGLNRFAALEAIVGELALLDISLFGSELLVAVDKLDQRLSRVAAPQW